MTQPSKFISNSDLSSTPSSLLGAKEVVLATPASVNVSALTPVEYKQTITFGQDFDTINFSISCDELPNINAYNDYVEISNNAGINLWVSVEISGNNVSLVGVFGSIVGGTFSGSYTLRAIIVPIKSPFSQS